MGVRCGDVSGWGYTLQQLYQNNGELLFIIIQASACCGSLQTFFYPDWWGFNIFGFSQNSVPLAIPVIYQGHNGTTGAVIKVVLGNTRLGSNEQQIGASRKALGVEAEGFLRSAEWGSLSGDVAQRVLPARFRLHSAWRFTYALLFGH